MISPIFLAASFFGIALIENTAFDDLITVRLIESYQNSVTRKLLYGVQALNLRSSLDRSP
jgi:hypothetical protein